MSTMMITLIAAAQVTAYQVTPLPVYDAASAPAGRVAASDLPPPPIQIEGTNEFGFLRIVIQGKPVYVRPSDVRHNMRYCGSEPTRRDPKSSLAASRPSGVRKGGAEDDGECISQ